MKINVAKNVLSFVLLITILMVSTVSFAAGPNTDNIQWSYISAIENYLDNASTLFTRKLELYAATDTYIGYYSSVTAQLQKKNGSTWEDVTGYFYSDYEEDSGASIYEPSITGLSSGTYRFKLVHRAYTDEWLRLETVNAHTNEVTI